MLPKIFISFFKKNQTLPITSCTGNESRELEPSFNSDCVSKNNPVKNEQAVLTSVKLIKIL